MRKRVYAILLATMLAGSLASGCIAFASETEPAGTLTAEESEALADFETEAEAAPAGLEPKETTGDAGWESQYPEIEAQVEQQLSTLSMMSAQQIEDLINSYNRQINLGVMDIANSMKDSYTLTELDDSTMATVKMLRNWYSAMDSCGEFQGVSEYTADMTDNVITLVLSTDYAQAAKDKAQVTVTFTCDMNHNITLMSWELKDAFSTSIQRAAMNTLIGIGTVFVVLLFLSFIIGQIHWIPDIINGKKDKKEQKAAAAPAPAPAPVPAAAPAAEAADETDDLELVAVITAAIAASEQAPADGFVVRSIRRRGRKSNWRA